MGLPFIIIFNRIPESIFEPSIGVGLFFSSKYVVEST